MSSIADRISVFYAGRVVESAAREPLVLHPRHPYTRALLDSLPHPEAPVDAPLVPIRGMPPAAGAFPAGCTFHPRCAFAVSSCATEVPALVPENGRLLACPVDPLRG
jgi:oligopeptide/dipeptide ABC transporter ATP-binding protein